MLRQAYVTGNALEKYSLVRIAARTSDPCGALGQRVRKPHAKNASLNHLSISLIAQRRASPVPQSRQLNWYGQACSSSLTTPTTAERHKFRVSAFQSPAPRPTTQ